MFIVRIADFLLKYSDVINFQKSQKVLLEQSGVLCNGAWFQEKWNANIND